MKRIFYILSAVLIITSLGVIVYTQSPAKDTSTALENMSDEEVFKLGEYYFNHTDAGEAYDLKKARLYYTELINRDPRGNQIAWYQLGRIDFIEGDFNGALFKFEKQKNLFPDSGLNPDYMVGLVYGYRARQSGKEADWESAENAFKRFIEYVPAAPWSRVDLAWIYFAQGKFEEMKPVLKIGLDFNPDNAWLHNMYGLAYLNTGELEVAHGHFVTAEELSQLLTPADWGSAYPGNDPNDWAQGLKEFKAALQKNIALTESGS